MNIFEHYLFPSLDCGHAGAFICGDFRRAKVIFFPDSLTLPLSAVCNTDVLLFKPRRFILNKLTGEIEKV